MTLFISTDVVRRTRPVIIATRLAFPVAHSWDDPRSTEPSHTVPVVGLARRDPRRGCASPPPCRRPGPTGARGRAVGSAARAWVVVAGASVSRELATAYAAFFGKYAFNSFAKC